MVLDALSTSRCHLMAYAEKPGFHMRFPQHIHDGEIPRYPEGTAR
jgi:hypothetical protein